MFEREFQIWPKALVKNSNHSTHLDENLYQALATDI